jgi:hypothetical protein
MNEFQEIVKKWHEQHDRLNTFKGLLRDQSGTRNGEPFYRWERLLKVFPAGTGGKASRGPELEYKSATNLVMGDPVKINVQGAGMGRLQVIRGYIKHIETSTEEKPHTGGRIYIHRIHRPHNPLGDGPYKVEQIMHESRQQSQQHLNQDDQAARKSYPSRCELSRRLGCDSASDVIVSGTSDLKLARDELENFTLVVDVIDGHNKRMPFETELTKIKLSNIYVQVAVFREHGPSLQRIPCPFDGKRKAPI